MLIVNLSLNQSLLTFLLYVRQTCEGYNLQILTYVFDWFYLCSVLLLFPLSVTFFGFMHSFDSISSNIDEVLLINLSANVFVFGDFNIHPKDWVTYSGGTDKSGELSYNFSISNDPTQIINFPTSMPGCDSHSPPLLDFFLSSDAGICSTMDFPPLECLSFS